jgi:hypothetical protein
MYKMINQAHSLRLFHTVILLIMGICLLAALMPLADFDFDGLLDSFLTDGLLLLPTLFFTVGLICLLTNLPDTYLAAPQLYASLIVPPPNIF